MKEDFLHVECNVRESYSARFFSSNHDFTIRQTAYFTHQLSSGFLTNLNVFTILVKRYNRLWLRSEENVYSSPTMHNHSAKGKRLEYIQVNYKAMGILQAVVSFSRSLCVQCKPKILSLYSEISCNSFAPRNLWLLVGQVLLVCYLVSYLLPDLHERWGRRCSGG